MPIVQRMSDGRYQGRVWDHAKVVKRKDGSTTRGGWVSKRFPSRELAVDWTTKQTAKVSKGITSENLRERRTVETMAEAYISTLKGAPSTRARITSELRRRVIPHVGHMLATELRVSHVEAMRDALLTEGYHWRSVNLAIGSLGNVLQSAVRDQLLELNVARVAERATKPEVVGDVAAELALAIEVIYAIAEAMPASESIGVLLAFALGLRPAEMMALRWSNDHGTRMRVEAQEGNYGRRNPKYNSKRWVPINATLRAQLDAAKPADAKPTDYIVKQANGRKMTTTTWENHWATALEAAGVEPEGVTPHKLRHAFGSYQLAAGHSPERVAKWMGHSNTLTLQRTYAHDVPDADEMTADPAAVHAARADRAHSVHNMAEARARKMA